MEQFIADKNSTLQSLLRSKYNRLSFVSLKKLLNSKDIKVNGKRTGKDIDVFAGDTIEIFASDEVLHGKPAQIVFEDQNILVASKPAGIEVCDGDGDTLEKQLGKHSKVYAVHRIDRNTTGLVIFAKNKEAKQELEDMFKEHRIDKYYLAVVFGTPKQKEQTLVAFHKKDAKNSYAIISDTPKPGFAKIVTKYKVLRSKNQTSLLEVHLETGKTHQIRAHLAHIGFPLVGDDKYGSKEQNSMQKTHKQKLCAYKLVLTNPHGVLEYLRSKAFELDTKNFYEL